MRRSAVDGAFIVVVVVCGYIGGGISFDMRAIPRDLLLEPALSPSLAASQSGCRAFRGAKATGQRGHERAESLVWAE